MGMNYFLAALSQSQIDQIAKDPAQADSIVDAVPGDLKADVESAWDALRALFDGAGFDCGAFVPEALWNGCFLASPQEARAESERLGAIDRGRLPAALADIEGSELYHFSAWAEAPDALFAMFARLRGFYERAAERGLDVVHYAA